MKTMAVIAIIGAAVLALGSTAWAAGNAYTHDGYGYCGWQNAAPVTSPSPASQQDATDVTAHQHRCGHWWGWLVPGHRDNCCTGDHGHRSGGSGRYHGGGRW